MNGALLQQIAAGSQAIKIPSPVDSLSRVMELKNLAQQGQMNDLNLQSAQRKAQQEKDVHDAILSSADPLTGQIDFNKAADAVARVGDLVTSQALKTYGNAQMDRQQKDALDLANIQNGAPAPQVGTPGSMTPASQAVASNPQDAFPVGVPGRELPRTVATQSAPIPTGFTQKLPAIPYPTVNGTVALQPKSDVEIQAARNADALAKQKLEIEAKNAEQKAISENRMAEAEATRAANIYTITDPGTGKTITAPKDIIDNILTQNGENSRQLKQQDFTAGENQKNRDAAAQKAKLAADLKGNVSPETIQWIADQVQADNTGQVISKYTAGNPVRLLQVTDELRRRGAAIDTRTAATRTKAETAGPVISQANNLIDFALDPKNADIFGKINGRWTDLMAGKIGTGDERMAVMAPKIRSLASLLAPLHGFRSANAADEFARTMPLMDSPQAFAAAVREYRDVAQRVALSGESGGGTAIAPPALNIGTVKMKSPTGQTQDVPADQVDHYKSLGAEVVK